MDTPDCCLSDEPERDDSYEAYRAQAQARLDSLYNVTREHPTFCTCDLCDEQDAIMSALETEGETDDVV